MVPLGEWRFYTLRQQTNPKLWLKSSKYVNKLVTDSIIFGKSDRNKENEKTNNNFGLRKMHF